MQPIQQPIQPKSQNQTLMPKAFDFAGKLALKKQNNLYRSRKTLQSKQSVLQTVNGQSVLAFCSNDYLGLASHPSLEQAFSKSAKQYGFGSGASHLVNGHHQCHDELENQLAQFFGYEACLTFSTGYMANLGVIDAICDKNTTLYQDKLNHASLIDGALLSGAKLKRYPHNQYDTLENWLSTDDNQVMIATDAVFSMDGDCADLTQLSNLAKKHDSLLMIDDAHGVGVLGEQGKGTASHYNLNANDVPIMMGTLGKAFGCSGAFVLASQEMIDYLVNFSRTYIYTTAVPPALAATSIQALELVKQADDARAHLNFLIALFKQKAKELELILWPSDTAIQPIMIGDSQKAMSISKKLLEQGILLTAIREPTVPKNSARLRVTLCASHTEAHIERLFKSLQTLKNEGSL
ncbi:8-amino-7-oxononanoate synthase [Marinicellulosiphila megalodicopiae]|uniref:8-amino-7-oxononanoate synthase n=1 Tax=Marinicellulosiphila megalodicopiae TaxID=2724896 RepID=UPI003BAEAAE4